VANLHARPTHPWKINIDVKNKYWNKSPSKKQQRWPITLWPSLWQQLPESCASGWVPPRPSDSKFDQNWKPRTREIPILSVVGCHRGPVIPTSTRIGSPGPGRFLYFFEWFAAWIAGTRHTTRPLIIQSRCTGGHVKIKQSGETGIRTHNPLILGQKSKPLKYSRKPQSPINIQHN
jgi:hypothetical protein